MVSLTDIRNARILVVDDKPANVLLLEGMLRVAGYCSVESTTNPREVFGLHRDKPYSLILLDLQMPGFDGFQVMQELKGIEPEGYLPVLVITAQPDHKLRALQAGAKDFVSKPFDFAELQARVHNLIEVRLLHQRAKEHGQVLQATVRDLEESREVVRLKTLEEQKRNEREFALAQETQESLLPRCLPVLEDYSLRAFNSPTRYVGGDFYDFLPLPSGEWIGVLADVSGKGMRAALLSSMILGALSMEFRAGTASDEVLNRVNRLLCEKSLPYQYVTLFLFLLRPDGSGYFINAGHNPGYVFRAATGKVETLVSDLFAVGMFATACFQPTEFQLDAGDTLLVYSDGLTDALSPQEEMFGEARLRRLLRQEAPSGSTVLESKILYALEAFTDRTPQTDDITFVIVERLP